MQLQTNCCSSSLQALQAVPHLLETHTMPKASTLHLGCHNVNGLAAKLEGLLNRWEALHLDVVAAVDTRIGFMQRTDLQRRLLNSVWRSYWSLGPQLGCQCRAGVS